MAAEAIEMDGRRLGNRMAEKMFVVTGTTDASTAKDTMLTEAGSSYEGFGRKDSECEVWEKLNTSGDIVFFGRTVYRAFNDTNDSRFSFSTRGGTTHIQAGLAHVQSYVNGGTAPDHKGLIGVNGDKVEGADIVIPEFQFGETHVFNDDDVTTAYKNTLADITGTTNDAAFRGYAAGEVLFLGADGTRNGDDADDFWEIAYFFARIENKTGIQIGDITGIAKEGWEYLWVEYEATDDTSANKLVQRPLAVHVERVYDESDYDDMDIT